MKIAAPLYKAVMECVPTDKFAVANIAAPPVTAMSAPPVIGTPLSLKVTVPKLPGNGATVAVKVTNMPPVVALGVAVSVVAVGSGEIFCKTPAENSEVFPFDEVAVAVILSPLDVALGR